MGKFVIFARPPRTETGIDKAAKTRYTGEKSKNEVEKWYNAMNAAPCTRKQCAAAQTAAVKRKYSLRRTRSLKNRKSLLPPYIFSLKSAVKCKTTARKQSSNALRCWENYAPAFSFLSRADFFLAAVFLCRIPFAAAWSILLTATLTASALSAALDSIATLAFLISVLS